MKNPLETLARSRALWNRTGFDPESDETLAQILDRGSLEDWRALYDLLNNPGTEGARLRDRVHGILMRVPTARPYFWLAALAHLGHPVDWIAKPEEDEGEVSL